MFCACKWECSYISKLVMFLAITVFQWHILSSRNMKYSIVLPLLATTVLAAPLEARQDSCKVPTSFPTTANSKLPNPFKFFDGTDVKTKADFECKNKEVLAALQAQELGTFPPKPSTFTATYSGGTLSFTAGEGGKSISFSVSIKGNTGSSVGVATITFNNDQMGQQSGQSSRGKGKFYDLYGSGHSAGALTAWAWGVDRVIDALEATTGHNIDTKRIGVTGCSRNGKGAFVAAALVNRIALGIPQESGRPRARTSRRLLRSLVRTCGSRPPSTPSPPRPAHYRPTTTSSLVSSHPAVSL
jgi:hypothetical protein